MQVRGPLNILFGGLSHFNFKDIDWAQVEVAYFLLEYQVKSTI
jgi:hypothetical protein